MADKTYIAPEMKINKVEVNEQILGTITSKGDTEMEEV